MRVINAPEHFDRVDVRNSVFLAGPMGREGQNVPWREEAQRLLMEEFGFTGTVLDPTVKVYERLDEAGWNKQVEWEYKGLQLATHVLFWVPRDLDAKVFGLTTNVEYGMLLDTCPEKISFGYPDGADSIRYLEYHANRRGIPVSHTLLDAIATLVMDMG